MKSIYLPAIVSGSLLVTGCVTYDPPSLTDEPLFGEMTITNEDPLHRRVSVASGGTIQAGGASLGFGCTGWIAASPDYRVHYEADGGPLRFEVDGGGDTTLVINQPDGAWRCNDDGAGNLDPVIVYDAPLQGTYNVFVGAFYGGTERASLYISRGEAASVNIADLALPSSGTGFFVTTQGHLVTSAHILEGRESYRVRFNGERVDAEVLELDKENDIALLKIDAETLPLALASAQGARRGEDVFALGYPLSSIQGEAQRAAFGRINALAGIGDDDRFIQIDAPILPGNSGGPVINDDGQVIGIVTGSLNALSVLASAGALPENVGYAIKSDLILELISASIEPSEAGLSGELADMVETAEASVVQVFAE